MFTSGQPFREGRVPRGNPSGDMDMPVAAVLVSLLGDDSLASLERLVSEERVRRAA